MSVIGPRPQLVRDMVFMSPEQRRRHTAKPGLSGLAQVNGRNAISWEDKLQWDQKYIENISFTGDIKIVIDTIKKAFIKQEGITQDDMATAEDFGDYLLRTEKVAEEEYKEKQAEARSILNRDRTQKKVLIVASVVSFIEWFNKENVDYLHDDLGCDVHIACNFDYMEDTDEERTKLYLDRIREKGIILHNIHFARSPLSKDTQKQVNIGHVVANNPMFYRCRAKDEDHEKFSMYLKNRSLHCAVIKHIAKFLSRSFR